MKHARTFTPARIGEEKIDRNFQSIDGEFANLARIINSHLDASATWNPGAIGKNDMEAKEVSVTGAELGDFVLVSFSLDVQDLILDAQVTAANTVTAILANPTSGASAIDLGEGTLYVRVIKK